MFACDKWFVTTRHSKPLGQLFLFSFYFLFWFHIFWVVVAAAAAAVVVVVQHPFMSDISTGLHQLVFISNRLSWWRAEREGGNVRRVLRGVNRWRHRPLISPAADYFVFPRSAPYSPPAPLRFDETSGNKLPRIRLIPLPATRVALIAPSHFLSTLHNHDLIDWLFICYLSIIIWFISLFISLFSFISEKINIFLFFCCCCCCCCCCCWCCCWCWCCLTEWE